MSQKILLYDFELENSKNKGFGARVYDILNAWQYCDKHGATLTFIKGQPIPHFADHWEDVLDARQWSSITPEERTSLDRVQPIPVWSILAPWGGGFSTSGIDTYSRGMKFILTLNPVFDKQVEEAVSKTQFQAETDIVVHIRWTDKVRPTSTGRTYAESAEQDNQWYWDELRKEVKSSSNSLQSTRVFICSDTKDVLANLPADLTSTIPFVWDARESRRPEGYCVAAYGSQVQTIERNLELVQCLKNLRIMQRCKFLIGARASYFFRTGELLHYPKLAINVKDSDMFKKAEYADAKEVIVRPCCIKSYLHFLNSEQVREQHRQDLQTTGITTVYNVLRPDLAEKIYLELVQMHKDGTKLVQSIKHDKLKDALQLNPVTQRSEVATNVRLAREQMEGPGAFTYSFKRTFGSHAHNCMCVGCRVPDSAGSYEFLDFASDLVGFRLKNIKEWFVSLYTKSDWLSTHADHKEKAGTLGVACVFSFSKDWKPEYGGHLHFLDASGQKVIRTVVPSFNSLNIFILDASKSQVNHFVSEVTAANKLRFSITGWISAD